MKGKEENNLKNRLISMMAIAVFLMSVIFVATPTVATKQTRESQTREYGGDRWVCGTANARRRVYPEGSPPFGNPEWYIYVSDDYLGFDYLQKFELVLEGEHCNIWIGLNDTIRLRNETIVSDYYDPVSEEFHFFYPWTNTGDGDGHWPGYHDIISMKNLTYIVDQFDNVIYPTDTTFFGMPVERPSGNTKIDILIFNIRDESFYSPETVTWYIGGYFSSGASLMNNRNIIHIDTFEWPWRLGPNPPITPGGLFRPYLYEGVIAHEFEHLIHFDMDSDEFLWVDEGCADFAGYLCGYGFPRGHIEEFLLWFWDESLTMWEGYLSDYGACFLFMFYMYEHYGGAETISAIVAEQANGIEGVNKVLKALKIRKDFDQIFQDWAIANYLDDTEFAKGIYGYYALDIPSDDTEGMSIQLAMYLWNLWYGDAVFGWYKDEYPAFGYPYPYGLTKPYSVNYAIFEKPLNLEQTEVYIEFDGAEIQGVPPHSGTYEWHSDVGNWQWNRLGQTVDIPAGGATLTFWTYYEIEGDWDYGYVEVHDLTTDEWHTLPGVGTIDYVAYLQDNPNVPEGFEPMDYEAAAKWNALTGFSGDWYQEVMDLTPFAGHTIELYFTYWTDGAWIEAGWFIDDIAIPEIGFFDDVEAGANGWTPTGVSLWYITDGILQVNSFKVNFIQKEERGHGYEKILTRHMPIESDTQTGSITIPLGEFQKKEYGSAVMIVANQPGFDTLFPAEYIYYATLQ